MPRGESRAGQELRELWRGRRVLMDTEGISQGEAENDQVAVSKAVPRPGGRGSWPGGQSLLNTQARSRDTKRAIHALPVGLSRQSAGKKPQEGQADVKTR